MKKLILLIAFALSITFVNAQEDIIVKRYNHLSMTIDDETVLDTNVVSIIKLNLPEKGDITINMLGNYSVLKFVKNLSDENGLQIKKMRAASNNNTLLVGFTGNIYFYDIDEDGQEVIILLDNKKVY